jgi:hypothetical protein
MPKFKGQKSRDTVSFKGWVVGGGVESSSKLVYSLKERCKDISNFGAIASRLFVAYFFFWVALTFLADWPKNLVCNSD